MANRQTTAKVATRDRQVTVSQHETDAPIIPVAQLERLQQFKPEAVDWVIQQTQIEAEHRRSEDKKINRYIFLGHLLGQFFALAIGLTAIIGGVYAAVNGAEGAGGTIAVAGVGGLAAVFLTGKRND